MDAPDLIIQPPNWQPPNFFVSEAACLRCATPFTPGGEAVLVVGSRNALYRSIGVSICLDCLSDDFDEVVGEVHLPNTCFARSWPRYIGNNRRMKGFVMMRQLENGTYRIGLHRGHAEVWTKPEVTELGVPQPGEWAYSADYQLCGPTEVLRQVCGTAIRAIKTRVVDLSNPEPITAEKKAAI